jgi:hypothetical protein
MMVTSSNKKPKEPETSIAQYLMRNYGGKAVAAALAGFLISGAVSTLGKLKDNIKESTINVERLADINAAATTPTTPTTAARNLENSAGVKRYSPGGT